MPKPRKRYCKLKRLQRAQRVALTDLCVVYLAGDAGCSAYNLKTDQVEKITLSVAEAFEQTRAKWSVYLAVFGRRQDGQEYMKSAEHFTDLEYTQKHLAGYLNDQHRELINSFNKKHTVGIGWIAIPRQYEMSEEHAGKIFNNMGAWDNAAQWEIVE